LLLRSYDQKMFLKPWAYLFVSLLVLKQTI
jgi:hypothetical protein